MCLYLSRRSKVLFGGTIFWKRLKLMWFFGLLATLFHPALEAAVISIFESALITFRHLYWFSMAAFFYYNHERINWYLFSKYVFFGVLLQVLSFYFFSFHFDFFLVSIKTSFARNAFVFNLIIFWGFVIYYFVSKYGKKFFLPASFSLVIALLSSNGRSGAVIAIFLFFISILIVFRFVTKKFKLAFVIVFSLIALFNISGDLQIVDRTVIGSAFESISPRFAELIKGKDSGDLEEDKSWLVRELMLTKTAEIFQKYPIIGIGYDNFRGYDADLKALNSDKFIRLQGESTEYLNTRSTHNSYAEYLCDTGLVGIFLLFSLLIPVIYSFFKEVWGGSAALEIIICTGLIGGAIHGYAITAFTGANFWLLLGISAGCFKNKLFK